MGNKKLHDHDTLLFAHGVVVYYSDCNIVPTWA
jgi:hypothetical protein